MKRRVSHHRRSLRHIERTAFPFDANDHVPTGPGGRNSCRRVDARGTVVEEGYFVPLVPGEGFLLQCSLGKIVVRSGVTRTPGFVGEEAGAESALMEFEP